MAASFTHLHPITVIPKEPNNGSSGIPGVVLPQSCPKSPINYFDPVQLILVY
jgi:hypothetical protein